MNNEQEWRKLLLSEIKEVKSEVAEVKKEVMSLKLKVAGVASFVGALVSGFFSKILGH